jgi:hypothetical protein
MRQPLYDYGNFVELCQTIGFGTVHVPSCGARHWATFGFVATAFSDAQSEPKLRNLLHVLAFVGFRQTTAACFPQQACDRCTWLVSGIVLRLRNGERYIATRTAQLACG